MAYERRFSIVFLSLLTAVTHVLSRFSTSSVDFLRSLTMPALDWPDFRPDAAVSLVIDRISRFITELDLPGHAARFKSFIARALLHDEFDGERFATVRQPA